MNGYRFFFVSLLLLLACIPAGFASAVDYSGMVVDRDGNPINNAIIRVQGSPLSTRTDRKGHFELGIGERIGSGYITAGKLGFYNSAQPLTLGKNNYHIVLKPIPTTDNKGYRWLPSLQPPGRPTHY
jgi:hypothetical protein